MQSRLLSDFQSYCPDDSRVVVAYSGGLDSRVLLHLAQQTLPKVTAIHVNHQLQPLADTFEQHCRSVCQEYGVELFVHRVEQSFHEAKAKNTSLSVEVFAREQRYKFFAQYAQNDNDVILLAHHQGDQAETVLLNLLRGTGIDGLKGMPIARSFGAGQIVRPLLNFSRAELERYAHEQQLEYIDDSTNTDTAMSRNFLRHEVMPLLQSRWHDASKKIADTAQLLQTQLPERQAPERIVIEQLRVLSPTTQAEQVRDWVKSKTGVSLSRVQTSELLNAVAFAKEDAQPSLMLTNDIVATRFANELVLRRALPELANEYACQPPQSLVLPHGELTWEVGQGIDIARLTNTTIRFCVEGLTFHPHTRTHSQKLKKLFQEAQIPFWLRPVTPLIFVGGELIVVGGLGVRKDWFDEGEHCMMPSWVVKSELVSLN